MGRTIAQDLSLVPPSGMSLLFQVQVQIVLTSHVLYHMGCAYCGTLAPATPRPLSTPPPPLPRPRDFHPLRPPPAPLFRNSPALLHRGVASPLTSRLLSPLPLRPPPPPRCSQLLGLAAFSQINLGYRSLCLPGVSYFISFL